MINPADNQTEALALELPGNISNAPCVTGMPDSDQAGVEHALCPTRRNPRGRPKTGNAMTPAEKQRAYRQRLAEQQNNQVPAVQLEKVRSTAAEHLEKLGQQLADAKAETAAAIARADKAETELEALAKELQKTLTTIQEMKKGNVTENEEAALWNIERRYKGDRKWTSVGELPIDSKELAVRIAKELGEDCPPDLKGKYRVIQVKAPK